MQPKTTETNPLVILRLIMQNKSYTDIKLNYQLPNYNIR